MKLRLKIQYILSYGVIAVSAVFFLYTLGFMTDFFVLFMDGNSEMYDYFKDLQILNQLLFSTALAALVMSLFLPGFDINKKRAGIFGLLYVVAINAVIMVNGGRIITFNEYFLDGYRSIDFAALTDYSPSQVPFQITYALYALVVALSVSLLVMTAWNFVSGRRKGGTDD